MECLDLNADRTIRGERGTLTLPVREANERKMTMKRMLTAVLAGLLSCFVWADLPSEILVDLRLDESSYVCGERVRGIIEIKNMAMDTVSVGYTNSPDRVFVEVYRASDHYLLDRQEGRSFVSPFKLKANQGLKLEVFLGDHYDFTTQGRYLARPVLVHAGMRYSGLYRAFDVVPGMKVASAVQMFSNRPNLSRVFDLLRWSRRGTEHLFLSAHDEGAGNSRWMTSDIGAMMRTTKPTISILSGGEVIVFHRNGPDSFVRSEFWSLPNALDFRTRQMVRDPETAGQQSVQEMYRQGGKVEAKSNPWWKFW